MRSIGKKFAIVLGIFLLAFSVLVVFQTWSVSQRHVRELTARQTALEFDLAIRKYVGEKVLDFSRIESGKLELDSSDFVLHECVSSVIGIKPGKLETIFGGFEQADGASTREYGGMELGLENGFRGLILMDVMMPGMNGWETIGAIVDKGLMEENVICMLTAVDSPSPRLEELKEYVLEYFRKPFNSSELVAAVSQYLQLVPQELGT